MRICYLSSRFPYPVEKGDKLRAYHHIRHLSGMHEVHLLALSHEKVGPEQIEELKKFCASVSVFRLKPSRIPVNLIRSALKGLPFQVGYFQDPAVKKELQKTLIAADPDLLISQLIRTTEYARGLPCFKVLDYMDVFSIGAAQRSRSGNWLLRPIYALEHHLVKNYERQIYADFNRHMIISRQDRDRLPLPYSKSVRVVPNGVNLEYFQPMKTEPRYDVVFVGNMGYLPNIEAAQYLVRRIMPNVWNQYPEARVCLAGARPSEKVRRLQSERVEVTGWVEDIRPYYASSSVFVAPMLSGMGLQNKILEAMSMGIACVTTPIVNSAIHAEPGREVMIGTNAQSLADQIIRLLGSESLRVEVSKSAREFVEDKFAWEVQNSKLTELIIRNHQYAENV